MLTGLLVACPTAGLLLTLVAWGAAADRFGERLVLASGLAGAGVDVTEPEPLPKGHPLWKFNNAIITPHVAGFGSDTDARRQALIVENAKRFVRGEPLRYVIDKALRY